jgi:tetratricopeptide (TPR) repeat protein
VPFVPQRTRECGPTSLAMVLEFGGASPDLDALVAETQVPERRGAFAFGMLAAARRHGQLAVPVGELASLLRELAAGNPVIVMQNLGFGWYPFWHFAVAIGYDLDAGELVLHSGKRAGYRVPLRTFELTWQRAERWALVVLPPERLPATAGRAEILEALAGLERAGQVAAAERASRRALERWPGDPLLWLARANALLATGELEPCEAALREALRLAPDLAPAHNNLADLLLRRGRPGEARAAVARAIELGGPRPEYLDTQAAVERACASAAACR